MITITSSDGVGVHHGIADGIDEGATLGVRLGTSNGIELRVELYVEDRIFGAILIVIFYLDSTKIACYHFPTKLDILPCSS